MTLPARPTPADVASHIADRFDEDGLPYAFGGALVLGVTTWIARWIPSNAAGQTILMSPI